MLERRVVMSAGLLAVIAFLTMFTAGASPRPTSLGAFVQYLIPAILTLCLLAMLVNAKAIVEILAAVILGQRKPQASRASSVAILLGYAIAVILVILFVRTGVAQRIIDIAASVASIWFSPTQIQNPVSPGGSSPFNPFVYYYTVILFATIVIASFTLIFGGLRTAYQWAREDNANLEAIETRREALGVVRKATAGLRLTGDYREVILRCYRQMCQVLSDHGFAIGIQETAREFAQGISQKLSLGSDAVTSLTFLFEEARYSDHQIDDGKRSTALNQLENLERSLAAISS
jgi:hypothetical protein